MASTPKETARVIIARDSQRDIKIRGLEIFVDGDFKKDLLFGKELPLELEAGKHAIKVTNRLYTEEIDIDLKPGETTNIQVGNFVTGLGAIMMGILGTGPYKVFIEKVA